MKNKILSALLLIFSILFLYYPTSYSLIHIKTIITFIVLVAFLIYILKKFNIKVQLSEKNYIFIILLLVILSRVGIVLVLNNKITQVSDFGMALNAARTGWFQTQYYQVFTHWIMYPKVLSQIFKIFGSTQLIALLTNSVTLIISSLLIYKNASIILKNKTSGFIAAMLYILWPANILYTTIVTPEHLCTLTLLFALYLFLNLIEKNFYQEKKHYLILFSFLIGLVLSLSTFFKNFAPVFLISFIIYFGMDYLQKYKIEKSIEKLSLNEKIKNILKTNNMGMKMTSFIIIIITFFSTSTIIFNKIEKDFVKSTVVRNGAPCYLNVGLRDASPENYQMYFDALEKNNFDYKKTNKEILNNLKHYLTEEITNSEFIKLLDSKAKIIFGDDSSKINFVADSIQNSQDKYLVESLKGTITNLNNNYFVIIALLGAIGLIYLNKEKNLKLFLSYLVFFGALLLILIIDDQNRYMYAVQPLMCINAIAGINILVKKLNEKIKTQKIIKCKTDYKSIFYLGLFLLTFIFLNIFIPSFMFLFNVSISKCYFYISLLLSIGLILYLLKKRRILNIKNIIITIIIPIIIIISSITISSKYYDYTWDGNSYHKVAIGYLVEGWNPLKEGVEEFDEKLDNPRNLTEGNYLWVNHYAKASYFYGASIAKVTNNVESGKSINIISMVILLCFSSSLLLYKNKSKLFAIAFGLIITTCSTISSQLFTNYVDCLVYLYLFMLMWFFFSNEENKYLTSFEKLYCYFIILNIIINIKFSSFGYAGIFCFGYFLWYIIRLIKKKYNKKQFIRFSLTSTIAVLTSICIIGQSVYIKNFIDHGHPFYPLFGEGKVDIMISNSPDYFEYKNPINKFIIATFSEADNISKASQKKAIYKIPFQIKEKELENLYTCDLRIAGNGIFFSGILIISVISFCILIFKEFKNNKTNFMLFIIPILITIATIFIMSDIWWARYFPQLHFVVFAAILLLEKYTVKNKAIILKTLIILLILNNIVFFVGSLKNATDFTESFNNQVEVFKSKEKNDTCQLKIYSTIFHGNYFDIENKLPKYKIIYTSEKLENYSYVFGFSNAICEEK